MSRTRIADDQLISRMLFKWEGLWELGKPYPVNRLVNAEGSVYISKVDQTMSTNATRPGTGVNWSLCWDLFVQGVVSGDENTAPQPVIRENPTGNFDGVNQVFELAHAVVANTEQVFLNGILQEPDGEDYVITDQTLAFVIPPEAGDRLRVSYMRVSS